MARDLELKSAVSYVRAFVDEMDERWRAVGPVAFRRYRHRQDDAGDAGLPKRYWRPAAPWPIYSLPKLLARIRRTYDSEPGGDSYLSFFERPHLGSIFPHIDDLGAEKPQRLGSWSNSTR